MTLTVIHDGQCRLCRRAVGLLRLLDWRRRLACLDLHDREGLPPAAAALDPAALHRDIHAVTAAGRVHRGFAAYRAIAWRLPLLWPLAPLLHLPPVAALGSRVYRYIADQRMRTGCAGGPACGAPPD